MNLSHAPVLAQKRGLEARLHFGNVRGARYEAVHDRADLGSPLRRAALRPDPPRAGDQRGQRPRAGDRHRLRRPHDLRLQGRVRAGASATSTGSPASRRRHPGEPRLAQRRLRPLRAALRRAQPVLHGAASPSSPSTRPSPTSTTARSAAAATAGSRSSSREPARLRIFVLHHHLLPIPGTGRERNIVHDAGDALECLQRAGANLVLSGHKHVPYAWRLEDLFIVNAGTVSCLRLRGNTRPVTT